MQETDSTTVTTTIKTGGGVLTLDTDSFIVGDRVWVNGVRPGHIAYIGETLFAPGEWAGVVLDEPTGKNDGRVGHKRYFYCGPNRGIFCRLWRLTRHPLIPYEFSRPASSLSSYTRARSASPSRGKYDSMYRTGILRPASPGRKVITTTFSRDGSPTRSHSSLSHSSGRDSTTRVTREVTFDKPYGEKETVTTVTTTTVDGLTGLPYTTGPIRIGDKVYVDSAKGILTGRVRFLGNTDFAPGYWAGLELDEPMGKNDGSVAGKR